MPPIDYASVKPEDLELHREPRKSTVTVHHKPTGAIATDPVVPGSLAPAQFRRPTKLPKENRPEGLGPESGYIESTDEADSALYWIKGDGTNEYLAALAADPEALKVSFEGKSPIQSPATQSAPVPAAAPAAPAPTAEVADADKQELDELLERIDS